MGNQESTKKIPVDLLCLLLLQEKDRYAYEMCQEIRKRSNDRLVIAEAMLYVVLYRFKKEGILTEHRAVNEDGSRIRVYYHLEPQGLEVLEQRREDYLNGVQGVADFMKYSAGEPDEK